MRTTLTLETDVAEALRREMGRTGAGLKATVNQALRRALQGPGRRTALAPFRIRGHSFGFRPGIDLDRMNQINDEMEAEDALDKMERERDHS
ncbi:MAG: hypothetical protein ACRD1Y_03960 [Terriglobales bacterium]